MAGDRGGSLVISKMGNGTRFKLSSVFPNVFSKIKGMRKSHVHKLSSSASVLSECASIDTDQKDFSIMSRDSHLELSPSSPVRTFPQNTHGEGRYSSSPVLGPISHDIRLPAESPIRSKGSITSGPELSPAPRIKGAAEIVDSGCCSYDSTMALVPHDGRVRRAAPQAFGRCLIMSKCNSFNGSTHSDSEFSETDSSRVHTRLRHSRAISVQLEGSSCEGYGLIGAGADERARHGSGKVSVRHRSMERRDQNAKILEHSHQQYGGSSPVQTVRTVFASPKCCSRADHNLDSSECRGSAFPNSSREGTPLDLNQTNSRQQGRLSRKLSFTTNESARPFDETSFSSDDDFYKGVTGDGNVTRGHYRSRSTSCHNNNNSQLQMYVGNHDTDPGYTSGEVAYTEDERNHAAAILRREALLAKTVLNASELPGARLSHHDEKPSRRATYDAADHRTYKGNSESTAVYSREATLVKTVLNAHGWARENLRALAKANELDRQHLARLKAGSIDLLVRREEEADKIEDETVGLPSHSRDYFSQKSSRHPSPISEEVEKYTEGRVDYKTNFSPVAKLSKSERNAVHEEFGQPVADYASNVYKSGRTEKSEKEFGKPWDTEFPSFRSDSILMGGGIGSEQSVHDERAALIDCTVCEAPTALTPRYLERQRQQSKVRGGQQQQQDFRICGKVSSRSPSPREEAISPSMKNFKPSNQSGSPRPPQPKRSPAVQEFSSGKKAPSRTPSPILETGGRKGTSRTPSLGQEFQKVKKSSRTPSPAHTQSPQAAAAKPPMTAKAEAGMQRLDSVAVVKASYDPYHDFRESMVEMILENDIRTAEDLEDLLQCYLSLNSAEYHKIIVQVFSDVWGDIFEQ